MKQKDLEMKLKMYDKITFKFNGKIYSSIANYISYNRGKMEILTGVCVNGCFLELCLKPKDIISFEPMEEE